MKIISIDAACIDSKHRFVARLQGKNWGAYNWRLIVGMFFLKLSTSIMRVGVEIHNDK